jgi:hemoglobin
MFSSYTVVGMTDDDVFAVIGEDGFRRLIAAFYRQVPADPVLGPMYPPGDLEAAEARLRDFLVGRFGGPPRYIAERGHPRLRMRHMPFPITVVARDRWMTLMTRALEEAALPTDVTAHLSAFFAEVATMLINRRA